MKDSSENLPPTPTPTSVPKLETPLSEEVFVPPTCVISNLPPALLESVLGSPRLILCHHFYLLQQ